MTGQNDESVNEAPRVGELGAPLRDSRASLQGGTHATDAAYSALARLLRGPASSGDSRTDATGFKVTEYVPFPFVLAPPGIGRDKDRGSPDQICGPLFVRRLTRGANGHDFGLQIVGLTLDGQIVELNVPAARLHGDPADLARTLADRGVRVVPGNEKHLASYLDAARALACRRPWLTAQPRLGWADGERATFVFPEQVIGEQDSVFQPERANRMVDACVTRGALDEWRHRVAIPSGTDDLATFILSASFTAVLLRPAGSDSFGINLCGLTSRGKTTLLQLAASVWGVGADPGGDARAFCRRWNATANALESLAEEHNDLPLPLDELGTFRNADELGRAIYNLTGGRGTERLKADGQRRAVREWRTVILSSGEISLAELMQQQGQQQKGGQALRIIDIALPPGGLFASTPQPGDTVRRLKQAASECYGAAGRVFVERLVERFPDHGAAREAIRVMSQRYANELADGEPPEIARAAQRFALVRVAGEFAVEAGILPWPVDRIATAVRSAWRRWRTTVPDIDDGKRAIHAIASFIAAHPGQFPSSREVERLPYTVAGYYKDEGELYLFTEEGLTAAIGDTSRDAALAALEAAGLLFKNDTGRKKSKHRVAALGSGRTYFYAIRSAILDAASPADGPAVPAERRREGPLAALLPSAAVATVSSAPAGTETVF